MREIKFRGKRKGEPHEWLVGNLQHIDGSVYVFPTSAEKELNSADWYEVIPETVGQYTGLKDKNDKEIWEGDYDADGNMIDWCDECVGYQFKQIDVETKNILCCHNCDGDFMLQDYISDFDVISNIHDNPKLLIP